MYPIGTWSEASKGTEFGAALGLDLKLTSTHSVQDVHPKSIDQVLIYTSTHTKNKWTNVKLFMSFDVDLKVSCEESSPVWRLRASATIHLELGHGH